MRFITLFILAIFFQLVLFLLAVNCFAYTAQNNSVITNILTLEFFLAALPFMGIFLGGLLFWEKRSFSNKGLVFLNNFQRVILIVVVSFNFSSFLFLLISFTSPYIGFFFPFINIVFFLAIFIPLLFILKVRSENQKGLDVRFFKRALVFELMLATVFALVILGYGLLSGNLTAMIKDFQQVRVSKQSSTDLEKSFGKAVPYKIGRFGLTVGKPEGWTVEEARQPVEVVNELGLKQEEILTFESPDKKRQIIVSEVTTNTNWQDLIKLIENLETSTAAHRSVLMDSGETAYEIGPLAGAISNNYSYYFKNKKGTVIEVLMVNASAINAPLFYEKWVGNISAN